MQPARQKRSLARQQAFLEAGVTLLAKREFDDIAISDLAAEAGSSVGAFYTRFADKEVYFRALQERVMGDAVAAAHAELALEKWEGRPLTAVVEGIIRHVHRRFIGISGALVRATVRRAFVDRTAWQPISRARDAIAEQSHVLILAHLDPACAPPTPFQIRFCMQIAGGTFTNAMLNNPGPVAFEDDNLPVMLTEVWMRYLKLF